jgi:hypothetical protein
MQTSFLPLSCFISLFFLSRNPFFIRAWLVTAGPSSPEMAQFKNGFSKEAINSTNSHPQSSFIAMPQIALNPLPARLEDDFLLFFESNPPFEAFSRQSKT